MYGLMIYELRLMVQQGKITIRSAAFRLYRAGIFNFIPNDREVLKYLHINV